MFVFQIVAENVWTPGHDSHLSNVGVIEVTVEVTDVPDVPPFWVKAPPLTLLSGMDRMQKTLLIDFERLRNIGHVTLQLRYFSDPFFGSHTRISLKSHDLYRIDSFTVFFQKPPAPETPLLSLRLGMGTSVIHGPFVTASIPREYPSAITSPSTQIRGWSLWPKTWT